MTHRVWVFFYGSYMNLDVLREVDLVPGAHEVATLPGYDIEIVPRANIFKSPGAVVHGIIATATHQELDRLYSEHAQKKLGGTWLPEAVIVSDKEGRMRPALTYIAPGLTPGPTDEAYVERIARPAEAYGFPANYVAKLRSFSQNA